MKCLNHLLLLIIVGTILIMTIGYSVLESNLRISGEVNYRPEENVRITNFTTNSVSENVNLEYFDFSKHEVKLGYTTTSAASITFNVEVSNFSNVNMGILKIDDLDNNVAVQNNIIGKKLVDPAGTSTFTITFNSTTPETKTYLLKFDFEEAYTITYKNIEGTYQNEILKGDNLNIDFGSNAPSDVLVDMNNSSISNFVYENGHLLINNVTGNIVVTGTKTPSFTDESGANAPVLNGDMIPVVYNEELGQWQKQELSKSYDYSKQMWANAVTVAENSIKDLSGNYNNGMIYGAKLENGVATLDGIDDYIDCGLESYDFKNSFSARVRFKVNEFTGSGYILGNANGSGLYVDVKSDQKIYFGVHDGSSYKQLASDFILEKDIYYDLVVTFDGKEEIIYLKDEQGNNMKVTSQIFPEFNNTPSIMPFYIGANPDTNSMQETFNISINNISIYDRAIQREEIENNDIKNDDCLLDYDFNILETRETFKNAKVGTIIPMGSINTMWVWIPRYSYTIKSEDGKNYYGKASLENSTPTQALPGEIDVKFIKNETETGTAQYTGDNVSGWRTNAAFDFDEEKRSGIWVGKFEISGMMLENWFFFKLVES